MDTDIKLNNNNLNDTDDEQFDFESMMEESLSKKDNFSNGDIITGKIISIGKETSFVDISGKSEAIIKTEELMDDKGRVIFKKNDPLTCYIVSTKKGEIEVTMEIGKGFMSPSLLGTAYHEKLPVTGKVAGTTNGGFQIHVGEIYCFCPFSQMDSKKGEDPSTFVNKYFKFLIVEYKNSGRNIVLSRRALNDIDKSRREAELKEKLKEGDFIDAKVSRIEDFGLFVDLGGIDGLVPRAEVSYSRLVSPRDFNIGDSFRTKVLSIDWETKKISLSIKQAMKDPWTNISKYSGKADVHYGRVSNIIKNGAFVELEPGIEGFIPVFRMSYLKKITNPEEAVRLGESVRIRVIDINEKDRKLSLDLVTEEDSTWNNFNVSENEIVDAVVESAGKSGLTARLSNGMECFVPKSELVKTGEIEKSYKPEDKMKLIIIETNQSQRKHVCSEKKAESLSDRIEISKYMENKDNSETSSNLGSMFKDVFKDLNNKIKK